MVYTFQVVSSSFHRGKVAVVYEPNSEAFTTLSSYADINKRYMQVFDIQETQEFTLRVNWASQKPWNRVQSSQNIVYQTNSSTLTLTPSGWNGYIAVIPFTSLQSPDNSSIQVNVFARCDNLHVNYYQSNGPVNRIVTESGELFESKTPLDLNQSSADVSHLSEDYFGEEPYSFRSLLKRYNFNKFVPVSIIPTNHSHVNLGLVRRFQFTNPYGTNSTANNLFSYLTLAYLGFRGSIRKRLYFTGVNFSTSSQVIISNDAISDFDLATIVISGISTGFTTVTSRASGTVRFVPSSNGGVEFDLPFYSNDLFHLAFSDNPTSPGICSSAYCRNYRAIYDCGVSPATNVQEDIAAGEDFGFFRFQGPPFHTLLA
jgi:hypothetical protein